jgi:hypothetical protein
MMHARAQAREANAAVLAAPAYRSATRAEQAAERLLASDRTADATARFYEASGLYQSAASLAETQSARQPEPEGRPAASPAATSVQAAPVAETVRSEEPAAPAPRVPSLEPQVSLPAPQASAPLAPPPVSIGGSEEPSRTESPEQAISELLADYRAALEGKDFDRLKQRWPGISAASADAIRSDFQNASRVTVDLIEPRITVSGTSGTVTFRRRYEVLTRDGQRLRTETNTSMTVRRTPAGWIIDTIRFSPAR